MHDGEITALICDDCELACIGLSSVLKKHGFRILDFAMNGAQGVEIVSKFRPDIVLMDVIMPVMDGIEATCRIKKTFPEVKVLMITASDDEKTILSALASGADGYCLKQASLDHIVEAVKVTIQGGSWLDPSIAMRVLRNCARESLTASQQNLPRIGMKDTRFKLSTRELEVLQLLVQGASNQEIAGTLVLSIETVKTHMRHIMEKLAVSDRTQAAVKALRESLVSEFKSSQA